MTTTRNVRRALGVLLLLVVAYFLLVRRTLHGFGVPFFTLRPVIEDGYDYTELVNVFIGTTNGGHVFPGATIPHGMVKAGMDTDSPGNVRYTSSLTDCASIEANSESPSACGV